MEFVSKYITYKEVVKSKVADNLNIENIPNETQLHNIKLLCLNVFDKVREFIGHRLGASSIFRSIALNKELDGAKNSQHLADIGAAMDIDADIFGGTTNLIIFDYIKDKLEFDQLIAENVTSTGIGWVHVSYNENKNRKQVLIMVRSKGKTIYLPYTKTLLNKYLNK